MGFVERHGIRVIRMREVTQRGIEAVVREALDIVTDGTDAFYCSLDSDVVDASAMPGTDAPERGCCRARCCERASSSAHAVRRSWLSSSSFPPRDLVEKYDDQAP
jgi:arginase family enzyme